MPKRKALPIAAVDCGAAATCSTASASAHDSANTDTQSSDLQAGTTPSVLNRPGVGFRPTMLLKPAGPGPERAVPVPSAKLPRPAATATPEPELEPPGTNAGSNGFFGTPQGERTPPTP